MYPVETTQPDTQISVSRADARAYERYWTLYENDSDVFAKLGMFLSKQDGSYVLPGRVGHALGAAGAKSTVSAIRQAVPRICDFYAATLLAGSLDEALPFEAGEKVKDADKLKDAVGEVHKASNLAQTKEVLKRAVAIYGQAFIKVTRPDDKDFVYLQILAPQKVTDYDTDERGNVVYARIDTPDTENTGTPSERKVWRSEVWSKKGRYALTATAERSSDDTVPSEESLRKQPDARVYELGYKSSGRQGERQSEDEQARRKNGIRSDFIPLVAVDAKTTGEKRPRPVYASGLNLMFQLCKEATRLSDLLFSFNRAWKAVVGIGNDPSGRPLPPPRPDGVRDLGQMQSEQSSGDGTMPFGGSRGTMLNHQEDISIDGVAVVGLPGTANVVDIAPNIDYGAAREWIRDHLRELYEECPELLYYAVESRANQSGAALRTLIAGALDRAQEMRSNILSGLIKADEMALTVAQLAGIEGFSESEIGRYQDGDFEHSFSVPEILPQSDEEAQVAQKAKLENAESLLGLLNEMGVARDKQREVVLQELGYENLLDSANDAESGEQNAEREPESPGEGADDRDAARAALERRLSG